MKKCGHQICERFACCCAGFDDDMVLFFKRAVHGVRHSYLRGPELVIVQPLRERSTWPEELLHHDLSVPPARSEGVTRIVTAIYTDLLMIDTISITPEFQGVASIGILQIDGIRVQESPEELKTMLDRIAVEYAARYKDQPLGEVPTIRKIRAIFHRAGLDPTRYR